MMAVFYIANLLITSAKQNVVVYLEKLTHSILNLKHVDN